MKVDEVIRSAIKRCDGVPIQQIERLVGCIYFYYLTGEEHEPNKGLKLYFDIAKREIDLKKKCSESVRKTILQNSENKRNNIRRPNRQPNRQPNKLPKRLKSEAICLDLSFITDDGFLSLWTEWMSYKNEIKKPYKAQRGVEIAYNQFYNMCNGDLKRGREIVEYAIGRGWEGLYDTISKDSNQASTAPRDDRGKNYTLF